MQQPICVLSKVKSQLYVDAIPGHFATNHSHINYYIDMSDLKHKQSLAMTAARSIAECVEYYGGHVVGNAALFSNISELDGKPVVSLFTGADFPNYQTCAHGKNCPACAAGIPLDAIVTPRGYRKL